MYFSDFSGLLMTVCFIFCYLPQIWKINETKSVKDISPAMFLVAALGNLFAILYGSYPVFQGWLVLESAACLILILSVLGLYIKYKEIK